MEIILKPRNSGKTTELIKKSAESGHYIVCYNMKEVAAIAKHARELNLNIPFPLTYDEFFRKQYHAKGIKGFLIDNAELLLQEMTRVKIYALTITSND